MRRMLQAAMAFDPTRAAVYEWWHANVARAEFHHAWPKWMQGDHDQPKVYLPRCLHNMGGVQGVAQRGFHQHLERNWRADTTIRRSGVHHEDSRGFQAYVRDLMEEERIAFYEAVQAVLLDAYENAFSDESIVDRISDLLVAEFDRITAP